MPAAIQCPSFYAQADAYLLGRVGADGRVGLLLPPLRVTEDFLHDTRSRGAEPEVSYRFHGPCHQTKCEQWKDEGCEVIRRVVQEAGASEDALPPCSIRAMCRWHRQEGDAACRICPWITRLSAAPA